MGIPQPKKKINVAGHQDTKSIKVDIQALLRDIVIIRDKKCILYGKKCWHEVGEEGVVWQAEHLIERSNSATYGDSRLVVLVCRGCHYWKHVKKSNHDEYDEWVKSKLSKERVQLWERCQKDVYGHKTKKVDWKVIKLVLEKELRDLKK